LELAPEWQPLRSAQNTESGSIKASRGAKKLNDGLSAKQIAENVEDATTDDGDVNWEDMDDSDDSDNSDDSDEFDLWGSMDESDIEDLLSGHNEDERNLLTTLMNTNLDTNRKKEYYPMARATSSTSTAIRTDSFEVLVLDIEVVWSIKKFAP